MFVPTEVYYTHLIFINYFRELEKKSSFHTHTYRYTHTHPVTLKHLIKRHPQPKKITAWLRTSPKRTAQGVLLSFPERSTKQLLSAASTVLNLSRLLNLTLLFRIHHCQRQMVMSVPNSNSVLLLEWFIPLGEIRHRWFGWRSPGTFIAVS